MILGRFSHHIIALLLLALLIAAPVLPASEQHVQFAPVVTGQAQQVTPRTEQVYACQCGSAVAWVDPTDGTVLVTFLAHNEGGRVRVAIDNGQTFTVLPDMVPVTAIAADPSFTTPGLKDAPGMAVRAFGRYVLYLPMRTEPDGRYNLHRVVWE